MSATSALAKAAWSRTWRGELPVLVGVCVAVTAAVAWALGLFAGSETPRVVAETGPWLARVALYLLAAGLGASTLAGDLANRQLLARPIREPTLVGSNAVVAMASLLLIAVLLGAAASAVSAAAGAATVAPFVHVLQQVPGAWLVAALSAFLVIRNPILVAATIAFGAAVAFSSSDAIAELARGGRLGPSGPLVQVMCRVLPAFRSSPQWLDHLSVVVFLLAALALAAVRLRWRKSIS
jgi:hypothetical protein